MEYIIIILIVFIFINTILKLSFWKGWQCIVFGLICALFILATYQYAIIQSKTQIAETLNNRKTMQDLSVLITLESVLCFAYCFSALRALFGKRPKTGIRYLHGYPGLLVFPALFYVLTTAIFGLPGIDFSRIAWIIAGGVAILIPVLSQGIRWYLPEKELRLEIHFIVSLFVAVTGLISTVNGNVTYQTTRGALNVRALLLSFGLFLVLFVAGYLLNKFKFRKKH
ncbi:MAG: hypothetical protein EZS26_002857 [Candidatus Ordinivivax streblomastigis]|uniref:Uncharacterized protein n=1 Tax=Candidatus Ordinivivax streblomastigis TaxID=2540710 RepID=A0A5M8NYM2_9BACT|nr:MAG: hypothetical protein EZS26_002857 [Candidatus Ordinivivax streblomastigis]